MPSANIVRAGLLARVGCIGGQLTGAFIHDHKLRISRGLRFLRNPEGGFADGGSGHDVGVVLLAAHSKLANRVTQEEFAVYLIDAHREPVVVLLSSRCERMVLGALRSQPEQHYVLIKVWSSTETIESSQHLSQNSRGRRASSYAM